MNERAISFVLGNLQVEDETQDREQEDEQRPYSFKKEQGKKANVWVNSFWRNEMCMHFR